MTGVPVPGVPRKDYTRSDSENWRTLREEQEEEEGADPGGSWRLAGARRLDGSAHTHTHTILETYTQHRVMSPYLYLSLHQTVVQGLQAGGSTTGQLRGVAGSLSLTSAGVAGGPAARG